MTKPVLTSRCVIAVTLLAVSSACSKDAERAAVAEPAPAQQTQGDTVSQRADPPAIGAIQWMKDDLSAARARSKAENKPLIVDLWAPWCHTCMSMKKFVLPDARIAQMRDDFVWLAIDTDKPANADVTLELPLAVWPTFYALAPDGAVAARHVGSGTVEQIVAFLNRARAAATTTGQDKDFVAALRVADAARATGDLKAAADAYDVALKAAGQDVGRFAAAVSLIEALYKSGDYERCTKVGAERLADMSHAKSASAADFTSFALTCSKRAENPGHDKLLARATAPDGPLRTLLAANAPLSVDDRSDAIRILRDLEEEQGHDTEAKKLAERQKKLLDDAVAKLEDPLAVMTFHWPRAEVYTYLGRGEELVPALRASAAALPDEYEPVYRLAWVLTQAGKHDDAVAPGEAAVRLTYGPRKARAFAILAGIHKARGDVEAERKTRTELIAHLAALPEHQQNEKSIAQAKEALAAVGAAK